MTDVPWSAVTYVGLPIGSGGVHSLGRMSRRVAYERTTSFLQTSTELVSPTQCSFHVLDVPELSRQLDLEAELERRFGPGKRVAVPADRVDEALELLDDIHPQPTISGGWHRFGSGPSRVSKFLTRRQETSYRASTLSDSPGLSMYRAFP
jgi:hypothetical protein